MSLEANWHLIETLVGQFTGTFLLIQTLMEKLYIPYHLVTFHRIPVPFVKLVYRYALLKAKFSNGEVVRQALTLVQTLELVRFYKA